MFDTIKKIVDLTRKVGWSHLTLLGVGGLLIILVLYGLEQRDTAVPALVASNSALIVIGAALMCSILGLIGVSLFARLESKSQSMEAKSAALEIYLKAEIERLHLRLSTADAERESMRLKMIMLEKAEEECNRNLNRARQRLLRAEEALQAMGSLPPARTDWGDNLG
jgi:hypothetical protein